MSEYLPQYVIEVSHAPTGSTHFVTRATNPSEALGKAKEVFRSMQETHWITFGAPVRLCNHPLQAVVRADSRTVSTERAERVYQCKQCGDYISVKIAV